MLTDASLSGRWPAGVGLLHLPQVDSTMSEAARRAESVAGPLWILADQQTGGRGRQGRPWQGQAGNLMATLIYRPQVSPAQAALRSFVAACALREALAQVVPQGLSLKWPNDLLLHGGKLAGILLESAGQGRVDWLAVGFGVNLAQAPDLPEAPFAPVSLAQHGVQITPQDFLPLLAQSYMRCEEQMAQQGFAPIRRAWMQHAARLGDVITARSAQGETRGTFEGIDEDGALVLRCAAGPVLISAADVVF